MRAARHSPRRGAAERRGLAKGLVVLLGGAAGFVLAGGVLFALTRSDDTSSFQATSQRRVLAPNGTSPRATIPPPTTTTIPSTDTTLQLTRTVVGAISPKSVVASGTGLVFAQNMMYRHTVTVYDRDGNLVSTIPDAVELAAFGTPGHPGTARGAPVEAAFLPGGAKAYVSNYSMYGAGFGPEGSDECGPGSGYDPSFVYRIDTRTMAVDQVIPVGTVPKALAVSPDGRRLVVSNWCSYDVTIVDLATGTPLATLPIGPYPRGVVVDPTSTTAYVALMGGNAIAVIDLRTMTVTDTIRGVGSAPRHLVISADGTVLYVTLNGSSQVVKLDLASREVVARTHTGSQPRTIVAAADGRSLYVVNYGSATVAKLASDDLRVLQTLPTPEHPVGITVDPETDRVWVACYSGAILVFDEV